MPKLVLLSHEIEERELLEEALSTHAGHKVEVLVPQRGEKNALVEHAVTNAREASGRKIAESSSQAKLLDGVAEAFGLAEAPKRIEIYDNSHISGSNPVGAMVVAGPDGFMKSQYRKFNIRSEDLSGGDDFAMMREMLTRRFTRLLKRKASAWQNSETSTWPDLVLIDGGQGQLSAVRGVSGRSGRWAMCRWWVWPRGRTGMRAASISTCRASLPSCWRRAIRCSIISSDCGTRRIVLPSAATGRGAPGPLASIRWTRFRA